MAPLDIAALVACFVRKLWIRAPVALLAWAWCCWGEHRPCLHSLPPPSNPDHSLRELPRRHKNRAAAHLASRVPPPVSPKLSLTRNRLSGIQALLFHSGVDDPDPVANPFLVPRLFDRHNFTSILETYEDHSVIKYSISFLRGHCASAFSRFRKTPPSISSSHRCTCTRSSSLTSRSRCSLAFANTAALRSTFVFPGAANPALLCGAL